MLVFCVAFFVVGTVMLLMSIVLTWLKVNFYHEYGTVLLIFCGMIFYLISLMFLLKYGCGKLEFCGGRYLFEKIIISIFIMQGVLALISMIMYLYDLKISKEDYRPVRLFILLLILVFMCDTFIPIIGAFMSVGMCMDCIETIKSIKKTR